MTKNNKDDDLSQKASEIVHAEDSVEVMAARKAREQEECCENLGCGMSLGDY
jgi:hypothetical protein